MRKFFNTIKVLIVIGLLFSCSQGKHTESSTSEAVKETPEIMVFAAASLTDVMNTLIDSFEVKYQTKVQINLASSGTLARQIEQGGAPDIYISASKKWADYVDSLGFFQGDYKSEIAKNDLVLIAPKSSSLEIHKIDSSFIFSSVLGNGDARLSVGDPSHVPAGKYAKQSLEYYGWYAGLKDKTLPAKDVRSALMVVELGESPAGIVYRTDAMKSDKVKIIGTFPDASHKPIVYVAGICTDTKASEEFFQYIQSEETKDIWKTYGFNK